MTLAILLAIVPIALLIGLGIALRRLGFIADAFWPQAERLSYYVLLPALFLHGLATARLEGVPVGALVVVLIAPTLLCAVVLVAARPWLRLGDPAFTSVFQGGIRFNNYVGVTAAAGLYGAQGVALAAVANAAIVPTVNVLCVLCFARYGSGGSMRPREIGKQLVLNPLVVACLVGIALHATGLGLSPGLDSALRSLGAASLPLGLLCVGAALDLASARAWPRPVAASSLVKFALMPLMTLAACLALGLTGPAAVTALLFQALPTASSSYIMARQLGGDAPLMAGITAVQTVLAAAILPAVLAGLYWLVA